MNSILLFFILLLVDSGHFIFARLLHPHISPPASAFFVLSVGMIEVGIYGFATKKIKLQALKDNLRLFLGIGILVASSTTINYFAVEFVNPGIASMLAQTGSLWALGFGLFWLRENMTPGQIGGAMLALVGIFTINFQAGDYIQTGSFLIVFSSGFYALHSALTKRYAQEIDLLNFFFFRLVMTTLFLFIFTMSTGSMVWPTRQALPILILAGSIDVAISRWLYYVALRRFKLTIHTIILTLSPVVAVTWSMILFNTTLTLQQIIGGSAVLLGVFIVGFLRAKTLPEKN